MRFLVGLLFVLLVTRGGSANDVVNDLSKHIPKTSALVVVVCQDDAKGLKALTSVMDRTPWVVLYRTAGTGATTRVRDWARERGLLGKRLWIVDDPGESLWLADEMADAVWVSPTRTTPPPAAEVTRVLHPGGVALVRGSARTKPAPAGVDQWRFPYHGPDNNVVSRDQIARLPGELRFQTRPVFAPMPNQTLFAGCRIFFLVVTSHSMSVKSLF